MRFTRDAYRGRPEKFTAHATAAIVARGFACFGRTCHQPAARPIAAARRAASEPRPMTARAASRRPAAAGRRTASHADGAEPASLAVETDHQDPAHARQKARGSPRMDGHPAPPSRSASLPERGVPMDAVGWGRRRLKAGKEKRAHQQRWRPPCLARWVWRVSQPPHQHQSSSLGARAGWNGCHRGECRTALLKAVQEHLPASSSSALL